MDLEEKFRGILWADPLCRSALLATRDCGLSDAALVAGALYQAVWNALTGRPSGYGVNDIDVAYFDRSDLSYAAEDAAIRSATPHFDGLARPVQLRNQARVHLWFEDRFKVFYAPLESVEDGVLRYASRTHAVMARLDRRDHIDVYAPYGLTDVFEMRVTPNRVLPNQPTHEAKAHRAKSLWPEIVIEPW